MDINRMNISEIEDLFFDFLKEVCPHIFFGTLPTPDANWDSMILIDCPNPIYSYNAYANGEILVYLYAKPLDEEKNTKVLGELERKLNERISTYKTKEGYSFALSWKDSDYDNDRNLHFIVAGMNLLIV